MLLLEYAKILGSLRDEVASRLIVRVSTRKFERSAGGAPRARPPSRVHWLAKLMRRWFPGRKCLTKQPLPETQHARRR